jgi:glyoxylase-like metal-dependent hydrolase (beta-lactamase superfamily II)/ferredoxin
MLTGEKRGRLSMANIAYRLKENVGEGFFVDSRCIDCDACRQLAPTIFRDHGDQSSVYQQPETEEETRLALCALVACPTGSIGTTGKQNARIGIDAFPMQIAENIYYCGFNAEASFGAWSYLVSRAPEEGGQVLVDSPRFSRPLVKKIKERGGVRLMFLTHQDDIADHAAFHAEFNSERIMHAADGGRRHRMERIIEGGAEVRLDDDLIAIPVPGHTRGSMVLLYQNRFLFTGDHLAWSPSKETLTAFKSACWYSWAEQTRSMEKLLDYDFEWVLPGHGRIHHDSPEAMRAHLLRCIKWMKSVA